MTTNQPGDRTIEVAVVAVKRMTNTSSGNPRFTLFTTEGKFRNEPDSAVSHTISTLEWLKMPIVARVTINQGGNVTAMEWGAEN